MIEGTEELALPAIIKLIPEVMTAAFGKKNKERFSEASELFEDVVDNVSAIVLLTLEMVAEPLKGTEHEMNLPSSRSFSKYELQDLIEKEIKRRTTIIVG